MKSSVVKHYFSPIDRSDDLQCKDVSLTQQNFKKEMDINYIVDKFARTGLLPEGSEKIYADVSQLGDFRDAMDVVLRGEQAFAELPAALRKRFGNDPSLFIEFCQDSENLPELVKLGLATKRELPPSQPGPKGAKAPSRASDEVVEEESEAPVTPSKKGSAQTPT